MIAIDTNVLLRYLLQDDKKQAQKANSLITSQEKILVTDIVLVETLWTLKGKKYNLSKDDCLRVVDNLFKEPNIVFEDAQTVWRALNQLRETQSVKVGSRKKDTDFADILILEKSRFDCHQKGEAFNGMYSFDVAAQQIDGIEKP